MRLDGRQLRGFYLPLTLAAGLLLWFLVEQLPAAPARTRLTVLVVTTSQELPRRAAVWRQDGPSDAQGYVELLTAANIPFEVMWMERFEIPLRYLVEGDLRKYSTIVLATPARNLSDPSVETLLLASKRYGISLLAAGDAVDWRLRLAFGIQAIEPQPGGPPRVRALPWAARRGGEGALPVLVTRFGRAVNYHVAAGGPGFLDGYGPAHEAVRDALWTNAGYGMVGVALDGVAALRMDDALFNGSSFQRDPRWGEGLHDRLEEEAWERIQAVLAHHGARMSVGVVTGYVDDGDAAAGMLHRQGQLVLHRRCGDVYDSREMRYVDVRGARPGGRYDYESEYRGLARGVREALLDPEVHGYTHVSPDRDGWCRAADRYTNFDWLMELAPRRGTPTTVADRRRILEEGTRRVAGWFEVLPSSVIPPSHGADEETELAARDVGFRLLDGPFLSILRSDRVIQNGKIRTFWAHWQGDGLSDAPLRAGYPFVVGLHDRELVRRGSEWFDGFLAGWRALGVRRLVTLRELAAHLTARLTASLDGDVLTIGVEPGRHAFAIVPGGSRPLEVPLTLRVRLPEGRRAAAVQLDGAPWNQYTREDSALTITLPAPAGRERFALRVVLGG